MRRGSFRAAVGVLTVLGAAFVWAAPASAQPWLTLSGTVGTDDNFSTIAPVEATYMGIGCTSRYAGPFKPLDDPANDRQICHSFVNLPKDIKCSSPDLPILRIHMRAGSNPLSNNDTLVLTFGTTPATQWSASIGDGNQVYPAAFTAAGFLGTWTPGQETTLELNLCSLPIAAGITGAGSISNATIQIAAAANLDVFVQDDTIIDDITLTLTAQAVELSAGARDFCSPSGSEPVNAPTDIILAHPYHTDPAFSEGFDSLLNDKMFRHSFNPLAPPGNFVVAAELEMGLIASSDSLVRNDTLNLDAVDSLTSTADALQWGNSIGSTNAEVGAATDIDLRGLFIGDWTSTAGILDLFTVNLDAIRDNGNPRELVPRYGMPGLTSVLAIISQKNRLDVIVQDDSCVDYLKVRFWCSTRQPLFPVPTGQIGARSLLPPGMAIPTLSAWGMVALVLMLVAAGMAMIARRGRGTAQNRPAR